MYNTIKTKKDKIAYVRDMIFTDNRWAIRALLAVYKNQTDDEQRSRDTKYHNNIGFSGGDAEFFSAMAERAKNNLSLSEKQMACIRKGMKKYAVQLVNQVEKKFK